MRINKQSTLIIILLLMFFFAAPQALRAETENFSTKYDVTFDIDEDSVTHVTQQISITNLTSKFFVSQYSLAISSEGISNIKARDRVGTITPQIEREEDSTTITLKFNENVVGKGKTLVFWITYDSTAFAKSLGLILNVKIPQVEGIEGLESYNVSVVIPNSFGPLIYSYPNAEQESHEGKTKVKFGKKELEIAAPRLSFGPFQLYYVKLKYHLENPGVIPGYAEVALPPDIQGYQLTYTKNLLPKPEDIYTDQDQNNLAKYNLGSRERKEVIWEGLVAIFYPQRDFARAKTDKIPQDLIQTYTQPKKYWETQEESMQKIIEDITDSSQTYAEKAKTIYDYVVKNLSYNSEKVSAGNFTRLGALEALKNPSQAVCMEFTDLFITLNRAAGIPAREVNGFAYTEDEQERPLSLNASGGDILHAWSQIYLPETGWVMVDPTWGSTAKTEYFDAFDLSHIAFVIKGIDPEYPLPAGSYKTKAQEKDVEVQFSLEKEKIEESFAKLSVEVSLPTSQIAPFTVKGDLTIKNKSSVAAFNVHADFNEQNFKIGNVPAGSSVTAPLVFKPKGLSHKEKKDIVTKVYWEDFYGQVSQVEKPHTIQIRPIYQPFTIKSLALSAAALAFLSVLGWWFKKKGSINL